jgi:hypothetical protein
MSSKDRTIRILILEDDLEVLSVLLKNLYILEETIPYASFGVTIFSEYPQVEDYVNKIEKPNFDIILLDRDCNIGGSFHTLDFEKIGINKIVSISTMPEWNNEAVENGVKKVCWKDHNNLDEWGEQVLVIIKTMMKSDE